MTNEHKDDLTGLCKIEIRRWKAASEANPNMRYMVELMEIALAALTAQSDGWKLVPKNATGQMVSAWREAIHNGASIEGAFLRMVDAAPEPL